MRGGIDDRDTGPGEPAHVVLLIPSGRPDIPVGEILLRPQVGLGQRRPPKGDARFVADNGDPALVTLLPQGYGGIAPGHTAADDHDSGPAGTLRHLLHLPTPAPRETHCPRPVVAGPGRTVTRRRQPFCLMIHNGCRGASQGLALRSRPAGG